VMPPQAGSLASTSAPAPAPSVGSSDHKRQRREPPELHLPDVHATLLHFNRGTTDVSRLQSFYEGILGLRRCVVPANDRTPGDGGGGGGSVVWLELPPHAKLRISSLGQPSLVAESPFAVTKVG
jgi:hypothetical protein